MTIWLTSDTHFNHANIIRYCGRPFAHLDEMNGTLIRNWNVCVQPNDTIYHLGDFALGPSASVSSFFWQLNGKKILVRGNHDGRPTVRLPWDDQAEVFSLEGLTLVHNPATIKVEGWVVHGHLHTRHKLTGPRQIHVGVDAWNYLPVALEEVLAICGSAAIPKGAEACGP